MGRLICPKHIVGCGRKSLISWVNWRLSLTLSDLTCLANGSVYCFLVNKLRNQTIPRKKIRENPYQLGYLPNYKLLQNAFCVLGVNKIIPVEELMAHNNRALQIFTCWFRCFFELNYSIKHRILPPLDLAKVVYQRITRDDFYKLFDPSLSPTERTIHSQDCSFSLDDCDIQVETLTKERKDTNKSTEEQLSSENVSRFFKEATNSTCKADILSKCEADVNRESITSARFLGFPRPEQRIVETSRSAPGLLNETLLPLKMFDHPIDKNQECVSKHLTELVCTLPELEDRVEDKNASTYSASRSLKMIEVPSICNEPNLNTIPITIGVQADMLDEEQSNIFEKSIRDISHPLLSDGSKLFGGEFAAGGEISAESDSRLSSAKDDDSEKYEFQLMDRDNISEELLKENSGISDELNSIENSDAYYMDLYLGLGSTNSCVTCLPADAWQGNQLDINLEITEELRPSNVTDNTNID